MAELTKERFKKVASDRFDKDVISRPTISYWGDAWRRLKKNPVAMFSLVLLILCIIMTIVGPYIRGLDFVSVNGIKKNLGPSSEFWFGSDSLGRDLFSRVWMGAYSPQEHTLTTRSLRAAAPVTISTANRDRKSVV